MRMEALGKVGSCLTSKNVTAVSTHSINHYNHPFAHKTVFSGVKMMQYCDDDAILSRTISAC